MKCYHCKTKLPARVYYWWVVYRGKERPHCSHVCKLATEAKKAQNDTLHAK